MIKKYLCIALFTISFTLQAQNEKVIKARVTKKGENEVTTMHYYTLNQIARFQTLVTGKHRFYLMVDENCRLKMDPDRSPKITAEESKRFNEILSQHKFEFYFNEVLVTDCNKIGKRVFPITILVK